MKNSQKFSKAVSAFTLTSVLLILIYYIGAIYPFGDHALFKWDMELQYIDFFHWWHRVLHGQASMSYSLSKSLGDNAIGLTAYYLSSPFNLLLYFTDNIPLFVSIATVLKLASASLTVSVFLSYRFCDMKYIWNLLLSVSYGLMGYNLCQASNIMWLDGVIWLPILMLGIWKLLSEHRTLLLYLSVVFAIISNWYTAYMICLFSFFYFTYEALKKHDFSFITTIKKEFSCFILYCITAVSGVLTTMFFFFPVIKNLLQGKGIDTSGGWFVGFHTGLKDIFKGCFFLTVPYTGQGLTLFCGSVSLIALLGFFISRKQNLKAKLWTLGYLLFFILCATFVPLENIWNGFRTVSSYYCRFSFVISFFILYIAAVFLSSFVLKKYYLNNILAVLCMIFTCSELFYGAYQTFVNGYYVSATAYDQYAATQEQAVQDLHTLDDSLFYRTEQTSSWRTNADHFLGNFNEGLAYGFMPLSSYSSTYNSNIMAFYNKCGYSACNRLITWCEPILSSDSLLGIKYLLGDFTQSGYEKVNDTDYNNKNIYRNPYALELGYRTSDDITTEIQAENTFEYQNELLSRIVGHTVQCYKPCTAEKESHDDGYSWTVTSPEQNSILYGYCTYAVGNDLKLYIDGNLRTNYSIWSSYKTFQVGEGNTPAHIVQLKGTLQRSREIDGVFYYLDMQVFRDVMREISQNQVTTLDLQDKYIKCEYTAQGDEMLLLTIPYDDGWTAYVNGEKVEAHKLQDIFTGIRVTSGINTIEMKYTLPGFKIGVIFSCLGVIVYSLTCFFLFKKQRHL